MASVLTARMHSVNVGLAKDTLKMGLEARLKLQIIQFMVTQSEQVTTTAPGVMTEQYKGVVLII